MSAEMRAKGAHETAFEHTRTLPERENPAHGEDGVFFGQSAVVRRGIGASVIGHAGDGKAQKQQRRLSGICSPGDVALITGP
jgi:hypothetical protein